MRLSQEHDPCDTGSLTERVYRATEHGSAAYPSGLLKAGPNSLNVREIHLSFDVDDEVQTCPGYLCH
jgi:hypothetical protein